MATWLEDACSLADAIRQGEAKASDALEESLKAIEASELNALTHLDAAG